MANKTLSSTNKKWNEELFNSQILVGSVMKLLREWNPKNSDEFKKKYYNSGHEREEIIAKEKLPVFLLDPVELRAKIKEKENFSSDIFDINNNLGRSKRFIEELTREYAKVIGLTYDEAFAQVEQRIFYDTFDGFSQEQQVHEYLKNKFLDSGYIIEYADSKFDSAYAVDLIIKQNEQIKCGIQVKPKTYLCGNAQTEMNIKKNKKFEEKYGLPVIYYFYDKKGNILTSHVSDNILEKLKMDAKS